MKRLSSNLTIFLKIFIPLFYLTFFGSMLLASFLVDPYESPFLASWTFRLGFGGVFFLFLTIIYFTTGKLKRVDADGEHIYINNYLKTFRYPWSDVSHMKTRNYGLFRTIRVYFHGETVFGKKISFLPSLALVEDFVKTYPNLGKLISDEE